MFSTEISKFNPREATWEPYSGIGDLQLEFTMLDPHVRAALAPVAGKVGKYSVTFRAPDRHGVFKFVINHKRKGYVAHRLHKYLLPRAEVLSHYNRWTHLESATVVPLVPPRHDEYPRFLSAAWPYYIGAISTSLGFLIFSALWLAGDDRAGKKGKSSKIE